MLNLISINNNIRIEYQLDETRIKRKSQHEIKVYLIELVIMLENEWCVIGKFALTIEFDETTSSFYLMFYNLEKKDTFRQEIFISMFKQYFEHTEFLILQSDEKLILLNFTCPEEATEFHEIFSTISNDILDYYFFNISEKMVENKLNNQSETDKSRDKLTFKSLIQDVKSLLSQTFNKKISNIKTQGVDTTSKIFKGISSKCDNVVNKLDKNEKRNPSVSLMRNSSKVNLRSLPDFSNNSDTIISRRAKNSKNTSEKSLPKKKSCSRIINNDTLARNQIKNRIGSMSNLISSKRKYGNSEQSVNNPGFENQSMQRPFGMTTSSIRKVDNKTTFNGYNRQLESPPKRNVDEPSENNMNHYVNKHSPTPNISNESRNTVERTKETPENSLKCKPNSEIVGDNSNIKKKPMDLLQQIRNAKLADLKKTKISEKTPVEKPFSNLYNIDLSDRRQHISESDNDSYDTDNFN